MLVTETGQVLGTRKAESLVVNGLTLSQTFYIAVVSDNGRAGHFTVVSDKSICDDTNIFVNYSWADRPGPTGNNPSVIFDRNWHRTVAGWSDCSIRVRACSQTL
jgi:hypothetical protein